MKKIILGCLLMNALTFEPVIGYYLFVKLLSLPDNVLTFCAVIFAVTAVLQIITYMSIIVDGFKDAKINHAMLSSDVVKSWNPESTRGPRY